MSDNESENMEDEMYEEEVLHEEIIDPNDGDGGDVDFGDDVYIDESTAGQPVYADELEGEGEGEDQAAGPEVDDSIGGFFEHTDSVYCIAQSPQQSLIITGGGDDKAYIWDSKTFDKKAELLGFKESVAAVGFSMDGKFAAAGDLNGEVRLWDAATGKTSNLEDEGIRDVTHVSPITRISRETLAARNTGTVGVTSLLPSKGNILLAGCADGCVYMWTAATGTMMGVFAGHSGSVTCGQFTPDGKKVVTGAEDGTTRVWNPKDQQSLVTFSGHLWHSLPLTCLEVKSDSSLFITGSEDSHACVGNLATGKPVIKLVGHVASVECVGFSTQHNNFVYSGSMDGSLKVWDLHTGQCRTTCVHDEPTDLHGVTRLIPLDNIVVTASTDAIVRVWDERTGACVRKLQGHRDVILDIITTPDKSSVITTSDDTSSRIFSLSAQ